jgi:predicted Zn-ribbon and HTH transcriptional regulator
VPRYPAVDSELVYRCRNCGYRLPDFQGAFWLVRERERGDGTIEVPYCPKCDSESIVAERE